MQRITRTVQRQAYREIRAKNTMDSMFRTLTTSKLILLLLAIALLAVSPEKAADAPSSEGPEYTAAGQLLLPQHYREWVWLTSDFFQVSDPAKMQTGAHRKFNNIFVNPEAYKAFVQTGAWPDKTMLVVEQRAADDIGSANQNQTANVQSSEIGLDVHVKDEARFPGKWAFFDFRQGATAASMLPVTARCYSCHAARGAVDSTFVQFYPTLLPIAKKMNTLSPSYLPKGQSAPSATR
jgi:Cytochrome P460